jgi:hypothetical protein
MAEPRILLVPTIRAEEPFADLRTRDLPNAPKARAERVPER